MSRIRSKINGKLLAIRSLWLSNGFVMPFQFSDGGAHGWKIYPTDDVRMLSVKS